ncbi:LPS translocon maturation chaperone LptM [Marinobacter salexigens]|uniref:Lipoprotein n=1 Tax=Marinobacter salexigens TaxID=1925763 RepID=A0ABS6A350_9GAMM|nr:lipoprotein [Marinobacter salexigens]MBU2872505.1 lipoprotein [Marinobacter salexigens]
MRAVNMPIVILVVATALGGCGQKGPLYRENPDVSGSVAGKPVSAEVQTERSGDRKPDEQ